MIPPLYEMNRCLRLGRKQLLNARSVRTRAVVLVSATADNEAYLRDQGRGALVCSAGVAAYKAKTTERI